MPISEGTTRASFVAAPRRRAMRRAAQRGVAMVLVILALVIAVVLAATFLTGQSTSLGISQNVANHAHARFIAESGLTTTLEYIRTNETWRDDQAEGYWLPDQAFEGGTFRVAFEEEDGDLTDDPNDSVTIRVVGTYGGVTHQTTAIVTPTVPVAANHLLLVVNDSSSLGDNDALRAKQAESWDYNVTLISASASQSAFNTAIAENDVVWVSPTASAGDLSTKLLNCTIGVVAANDDQWAALELSASVPGNTTHTSVRVVTSSHYITEPFGLALTPIFTVADKVVRSTSGVASGAQTLAQDVVGTNEALVAVDAGGSLADGSAAVGRRVGLPWGADAAMDFSNLSGSGLQVLQRSLEWAAAPPEGPPALAHWMFDESSGTIAYDSRGSHDGTVMGGAVWSLGQVVGSLEVDGGDDYVDVLSHDDFKVTNALTISAWVRPEAFGSGTNVNVIMRKGEGNPNNWQFALKDGRPTLFLDTYDDYGIKGDTTLTLGEWAHIVATWDGSTVRIYVNGQLDNGSGDARTGTIGTDDRPIYLGGRSGSTGYDRFDGRIDDIRFYNRAISAAEVKVMYEEGAAGSDEPRLIALYTFDEVKPSPALAGHWTLDDATDAGGGIAAGDYFRVYSTARIDSYDGNAGPYNVATAGSDAMAATNSTSSSDFRMDTSSSLYGNAYAGAGGNPDSVIDAHIGSINGQRLAQSSNVSIMNGSSPSGMPSTQGDRTISTAIEVTSDLKFEDLTLNNGAVLTVKGDQRIHCTRTFTANGNAQIIIADGGSLTIYTGRSFTAGDQSVLNPDTTDPAKLTIIGTSTSYDVTIEDDAEVAAIVHSDDDLHIRNDAHLYGSATTRDDLYIYNQAQVHLDVSLPGIGIDDPPAIDDVSVNMGQLRNGVIGGQSGAAAHTGTSVLFDGSNDHIEVPHHDSYLLDSGAIGLWFRADNNSGTQGLFSKDASGSGNGGHLSITLEGGAVVARLADASSYNTLTSAVLASNSWHHALLSFGPDGMKLFINGSLADSNAYTGGLGATSGGTGNTEPILIGADSSGTSAGSVSGWDDPFDGRIDDVRFYDYALDEAQVKAVMQGVALPDSTLPGAVAYDSSGFGAALDLSIPDTTKVTWDGSGGLTIDSPVMIASADPAVKIADAVAETDQFTLEARFATSDALQSGPARIVTLSQSLSDRNFLLGQSGSRSQFRLRTNDTGAAGSMPVETGDVLADDVIEHVIISYDGTTVFVYRNGSLDFTSPLTGELANWDQTLHMVLGAEADDSREWLGTLHRVSVYDRAFNSGQASNVFKGLPPGTGLATSFDVRWVEQP